MNTVTPPATWVPITPPPPNGHTDHPPSEEVDIDAATQHHQSEEKEEKVDLKKERKRRGHRGRIFLDETFERTPKPPRTPKPKTPKPSKEKGDAAKRKYTKRKLDKSIQEEVEDICVESVITHDHEDPIVNEPIQSNSNKPTKRVLDLNLDCQLGDEISTESVGAPKSSSSSSSGGIMCSGGSMRRASMQLRCHCCSCRIGKVKPRFPEGLKRLRTTARIAKAKRRRLLPSRITREAIESFFKCPMLLTHRFIPLTKRRNPRKNGFLNKKILDQPASLLSQQHNVPELDNCVGGEEVKVTSTETGLVNKNKKHKKVKTDEYGAPITKGRKKKKKLAWDENTPMEEVVDHLITSFKNTLVLPSLHEIHVKTQLEVDVDEETHQLFNLLKDREDDGHDPLKEEDEAKQKWWEEQRRILCEKAALFTMVMRQFLGNRAFSPWKGSVVDSVVGVYLTQNVSDNLSSSAFMSMVAEYPAKPPTQNALLCLEYRPSNHEVAMGSQIPNTQESVASSSSPNQNPNAEEKGKGDVNRNWDDLRTTYSRQSQQRSPDKADSVDWDAVRKAGVSKIAKVIEKRGQNNILAQKIKKLLDRVVEDHGSIDLEWLRDVPPLKAKEYLLSIHGIGLKSVECLRLLTLHHHAFPVDVNVGRIAVRLGWTPLQPLPDSVQFHLLSNYPSMDQIQEYLWPRLHHVSQKTLYELHYLLITFGKVFCTKIKPNCGGCPLREHCKYHASKRDSRFDSLTSLRLEDSKKDLKKLRNPFKDGKPSSMVVYRTVRGVPEVRSMNRNYEPKIEEPPEPEEESDIEDLFTDDEELDGMISIDLRSQKSENYSEQVNDTSSAIVTLSPKLASYANPKLKLIARMRTEHQVYEVPDAHPLLQGLPKRDVDDRCPYLLAIWPLDESCQGNNQTVPGTLMIPVRTAMSGSFPLNGTYFQVNEVFVDEETSKNPINVPRNLIWNLPKKIVYCGTSTTSILKGLTMEHIRHCFVEGYICVRAINRKTRHPKLLPSMFHQRPTSTPKKKAEERKD